MNEIFGSQEFLGQLRKSELDKASAKIFGGRDGAKSRVDELFKTKDLKEAIQAAITWGDDELFLATLAKLATSDLEKLLPEVDDVDTLDMIGVALQERSDLAAEPTLAGNFSETFTRFLEVSKNNTFNTAYSNADVAVELLDAVKNRVSVADKASATFSKFPFLRPEA